MRKVNKVVQAFISKDDFTSVKSAAENLEVAVQKWIDEKGTSDPQYPNVSQMRSGLDAIKLSKSDKELRTSFGLLSKGIVQFIRADISLQSGWQLFFCPMTSDYGYWLQTNGEKINNPYMGTAMLSCGSKKKWNVRGVF